VGVGPGGGVAVGGGGVGVGGGGLTGQLTRSKMAPDWSPTQRHPLACRCASNAFRSAMVGGQTTASCKPRSHGGTVWARETTTHAPVIVNPSAAIERGLFMISLVLRGFRLVHGNAEDRQAGASRQERRPFLTEASPPGGRRHR
jgi:hypothetical protein